MGRHRYAMGERERQGERGGRGGEEGAGQFDPEILFEGRIPRRNPPLPLLPIGWIYVRAAASCAEELCLLAAGRCSRPRAMGICVMEGTCPGRGRWCARR